MLELSLKEQKQINGGRILITCTAYRRDNNAKVKSLVTYDSKKALGFEDVWKGKDFYVKFTYKRV
ncbi:hypothetical protein [Clostridium sp. ZBS13]|uniref:hypothetical protein n=1 Tax=Clostridium sp. ZBS13 TaxID=2949971 RepID=UPI002079A10C|nr:hypothetical protein [Clostridium sp. ZBS13]